MASLVNLVIVLLFGFFAELIARDGVPANVPARSALAIQALFAFCVVFWLLCAQSRSSPGLVLFKLKVVNDNTPPGPIGLTTALLRPLPFFLFGIIVAFPVQLIPRSLAPVQFLLVLASSLLLAANAAPLWSGPNRYSLLDRWLKTRVITKDSGTEE
ncbi:MAG: hypothetical protein SynsKO_34410 [Synoicihabitans sp.]